MSRNRPTSLARSAQTLSAFTYGPSKQHDPLRDGPVKGQATDRCAPSSSLLRTAFHPSDPNYMNTMLSRFSTWQPQCLRDGAVYTSHILQRRGVRQKAGWSRPQVGGLRGLGFFFPAMVSDETLLLIQRTTASNFSGHRASCPHAYGFTTLYELSKVIGWSQSRDRGPSNGGTGTKRDYELCVALATTPITMDMSAGE
jgi:hypothetical protein